MTRKWIPVAEPVLRGNERKYVLDCLESGWISGSGQYVDAFEEKFAAVAGTSHAIAITNGTAALHVALLALGVGFGDEVIVPDLTYIASANAVTYCGARPVFADVDPTTRTLDAADVARKISPATKVIMPVHLYGHPAHMEPIQELAKAHRLHIVEDAAEAHGAEYRGRRVRSLGDVAAFSFFGNKLITTGEGGMLTTNDADLAKRIRLLKGQGMSPERRFWFPIVGYNYRMTNIQAAIGLAQVERIDWFIERRREVAKRYDQALDGVPVALPGEAPWARNVHWLYSVCLTEGIDRDGVIAELHDAGIETRPFFYPLHQMPPYFQEHGDSTFPIAASLAARGISLPSSALLSEDEIGYIADVLRRCLGKTLVSKRRSISENGITT